MAQQAAVVIVVLCLAGPSLLSVRAYSVPAPPEGPKGTPLPPSPPQESMETLQD